MAKATSIRGVVDSDNIIIGNARIFAGTSSGSVFDGTSKFDTNNPGSSWEDLRQARNIVMTGTTTRFDFKTGIPSTLKKSFVIGREAKIELIFDEFKPRLLQISAGLSAPINKLTGTEFVVAASPSPTATVFTLDSVTGLAVGDEVVAASATGGLAGSINRGIIYSIATLAVTLREPLQTAPSTGWKVKEVLCTKLPIGGGDVATYPLLAVVDFIGGKQLVWFMPKVSVAQDVKPDFGNGTENAKIPVTFDGYGVYDSDADDSVVAVMYKFEV